MEKNSIYRKRLCTPGPIPIPLNVRKSVLTDLPHHRTSIFEEVFLSCRARLAPIFGSKSLPLILSSSGTGAMESAVLNWTDVGTPVSVISVGKFGERWSELCNTYRCEVDEYRVPMNYEHVKFDIDLWQQHYRHQQKRPEVLFLQANETSTGQQLPVENISKIARSIDPNIILVVDGISSLCAHPMMMDKWGIDVVVGGSQKGFGLPPGLSFVALSKKALNLFSHRPKFYFDLAKEWSNQESGRSSFTPGISLIWQLDQALTNIHSFGVEKMFSHHKKLCEGVRAGFEKMNLKLMVQSGYSLALTSVVFPKNIDGKAFCAHLRSSYSLTIAGGQDVLSGKIFRFAHLGLCDPFDMLGALGIIELTLKHQGHSLELGRGCGAFLENIESEK